jgi:hypothetical protein
MNFGGPPTFRPPQEWEKEECTIHRKKKRPPELLTNLEQLLMG